MLSYVCVCVFNALVCYYVLCVLHYECLWDLIGASDHVCLSLRETAYAYGYASLCSISVSWVSTEGYRKESVHSRTFNTDFHHIKNQTSLIYNHITLHCTVPYYTVLHCVTGLLMLGQSDSPLAQKSIPDLLNYSHDTSHEKIVRFVL